jgi:ribonucleoside-diphosphate reductase alpha chain
MAEKLSDNALKVLERRYLKKDESGRVIESPDELFSRVAKAIAAAEKFYGGKEEEIRALKRPFTGLCAS